VSVVERVSEAVPWPRPFTIHDGKIARLETTLLERPELRESPWHDLELGKVAAEDRVVAAGIGPRT
jgi:hypothetical protein